MKIKKILGCPSMEVKDIDSLKKHILDINRNKIGGYSVAINAEKVMMYRSNFGMRASIDGSILPSPDGVSIVIGYKWLYGTRTIRVDLPNIILDIANENSLRIFLLGASEDVNLKAAEVIKKKHPSLILVGRGNGYYKDIQTIKDSLMKSEPDFVFICMGSPKQELVMIELASSAPHALFIGCGGALDAISGKVKRAPMFYQNNGLEWFYRIMQRPSLVKRKWVYVPFMLLLFAEVIKKNFSKKQLN